MKKLFVAFLMTCLSVSFFAQIINDNYPVGRYKFSISDGVINFSIGENNRWAFMLEEKRRSYYDDDDRKGEILQVRGSYTFKQDTLLLTPDADYAPMNVMYKNSSDVKSGNIRVKLENFSPYSENIIYIGNEYSLEEGNPISNIAEGQEENENFIYTTEKGDTLYISDYGYYKINVFAYAIPKNANDLIIRKNDRDASELYGVFRAHKGENNNELLLFIDEGRRPESVSFFFVDNKVDESLMQPEFSAPAEGFQFISNPRSFAQTLNDNPATIQFVAPTAVVALDTYDSYKDALKAAKKDGKYLLMYYEPSGKCDYNSFSDYTSNLNDYDKTQEFNNMFALYQVDEKNKNIFDKYNLSDYPAIVVLNADEEVIYTASNTCLYASIFSIFYNSTNLFKAGFEMQYLNTILSPKMQSAKSIDKKQLEKYLNTIADLQKNNIDTDDVAYYFKSYDSDNDNQKWNVEVNVEETTEYLNQLISRFYDKEKTTSEQLALVRNVLAMLDDKYPVVAENKLSPAYTYLAKAYENNAQLEDRAELFVFIVDKALYYRPGEEGGLEGKELYLQIIDAAPSAKGLLMPLVIYYFNRDPEVEYDELDKNALHVATAYLDNFTGDDLKNAIADYNKLYGGQYKELAYILTLFRYADVDADDTEKEVLLNPYLNLLGSNFNTMAWFFYEYVGLDKSELLQKALAWSDESLKIEPTSPYYLDTYAHLLYRLGRKQEAVTYQQKAIENIDQLDSASQKNTMRNALILMKNDTLW